MANPFTKLQSKIVMSLQEMFNLSFDSDFNQNTFEGLGYDGKNLQKLNASNLSLNLDYVGGANPIYVGVASPGTATSESKWKITKLTFDGNNNVTSLLYAGGTPNFDQVWDNRVSLSYW